jgi:hypothetical protein
MRPERPLLKVANPHLRIQTQGAMTREHASSANHIHSGPASGVPRTCAQHFPDNAPRRRRGGLSFTSLGRPQVTIQQGVSRLTWTDKALYKYEKSSAGRRRLERRLLKAGCSNGHTIGLAACMMFRDEADYLEEWLEFHDRVGFEHFFLYDNLSRDDWRPRIPKRLLDENRVSVITVPHEKAQIQAFNHCLRQARGRVRWLALLDADEFVYPARDGESMLEILSEFSEAPAVAINWQMFGTDGHILRPRGRVLDNYKACAAAGNQHVKVIVQPELTVRMVTPHHAIYVGGRTAVNELGAPVHGPFSTPPTLERLRINHYWTKSVEEYFLRKLSRGDQVGRDRTAQELIDNEKLCVDRSDDRALRFRNA